MSIRQRYHGISAIEGFGRREPQCLRHALKTIVCAAMPDSSIAVDSVEAAWSLVDPILDVWSAAKSATVPQYASGSWVLGIRSSART